MLTKMLHVLYWKPYKFSFLVVQMWSYFLFPVRILAAKFCNSCSFRIFCCVVPDHTVTVKQQNFGFDFGILLISAFFEFNLRNSWKWPTGFFSRKDLLLKAILLWYSMQISGDKRNNNASQREARTGPTVGSDK